MKTIALPFLLLLSTATFAKHQMISNFSEIDVTTLPQGTLVATDINDTLVSCSEPLWQKSTWKVMPASVTGKLSKLPEDQKNLFANLVIQKCVNQKIAGSDVFLKALAKRSIHTIALTAAVSIPLDGVDMEQAVMNSLSGLDLIFNPPMVPNNVFSKLKIDSMSASQPHWNTRGVAFTNGSENSKGDVLTAFVSSMEKKPAKILFFEDSSAHLETVSSAGSKLGIPTVVYQVVATPPGISKPTDRETQVVESLLDRSRLGRGAK